ncbi:MAG TPA: amidase family protein, partial [Candidatus Eisenbacteria bacterium]|nr:amidase family protein [Candidatus Eisenbacteria bacterium]
MNESVKGIGATAEAIAAAVRSGSASAEEITRAFLQHADQTAGKLGTYLHRMPEEALRAARAVDAKRASGAPLGALAGVPVAIKDNI